MLGQLSTLVSTSTLLSKSMIPCPCLRGWAADAGVGETLGQPWQPWVGPNIPSRFPVPGF